MVPDSTETCSPVANGGFVVRVSLGPERYLSWSPVSRLWHLCHRSCFAFWRSLCWARLATRVCPRGLMHKLCLTRQFQLAHNRAHVTIAIQGQKSSSPSFSSTHSFLQWQHLYVFLGFATNVTHICPFPSFHSHGSSSSFHNTNFTAVLSSRWHQCHLHFHHQVFTHTQHFLHHFTHLGHTSHTLFA